MRTWRERTHRTYPPAFKRDVVAVAPRGDLTGPELIADFGASENRTSTSASQAPSTRSDAGAGHDGRPVPRWGGPSVTSGVHGPRVDPGCGASRRSRRGPGRAFRTCRRPPSQYAPGGRLLSPTKRSSRPLGYGTSRALAARDGRARVSHEDVRGCSGCGGAIRQAAQDAFLEGFVWRVLDRDPAMFVVGDVVGWTPVGLEVVEHHPHAGFPPARRLGGRVVVL